MISEMNIRTVCLEKHETKPDIMHEFFIYNWKCNHHTGPSFLGLGI